MRLKGKDGKRGCVWGSGKVGEGREGCVGGKATCEMYHKVFT